MLGWAGSAYVLMLFVMAAFLLLGSWRRNHRAPKPSRHRRDTIDPAGTAGGAS